MSLRKEGEEEEEAKGRKREKKEGRKEGRRKREKKRKKGLQEIISTSGGKIPGVRTQEWPSESQSIKIHFPGRS